MTTSSQATQNTDDTAIQPDPEISAREASLRYVHDTEPGIRRIKRGRGFSYVDPDGEKVTSEHTLKRIDSLAIPPAWTDVWICTTSRGHLQATGRDGKGRKQYRYHPRWHEVRDEAKYDRMITFGEALPRIRERTDEDLTLRGIPRRKVLAVIVRLLEGTLIRVGNEEYARDNGSFGLTTLRTRHVDVSGASIRFEFKGKSGVVHSVDYQDRRIARIVRRLRELPGQELFQYIDDNGNRQSVSSHDVNDYLREITGEPFTAKDFRTWAGTVLAARALHEIGTFDDDVAAKRNVISAIETVAKRLGNTPTICRKCYVHPAVIDAYLDGSIVESVRHQVEQELSENLHSLPSEEAAVLAILRQRLEQSSN